MNGPLPLQVEVLPRQRSSQPGSYPSSGHPDCPRAVVTASRARAMAWTAAERTRRGQCLGSGSGGTVCLAMKALFKNLEKLSGQVEDNARERLDLPDIGGY